MSLGKRKAECDSPITKIRPAATNPVNSQQTGQLSKQMVPSETQTDRYCSDLINVLPFELLNLIFCDLDLATLTECLIVSSTWRYKLARVPGLWRKMDLKPQNPFWRPLTSSSLLPTLFQYVEEINIVNYRGEIKKYFAVIAVTKFPKLHTLKIRDRANSENMAKDIYRVLPRVSKTLKELQIVSSSHTALSIGRITKICRQLEYLKLDVRYITDHPSRNDGLVKRLISVEISAMVTTALASKLKPLIRYAPKLQYLMVQEESLYDLSSFLLQYCPKLAAISNDVHSIKYAQNWVQRNNERIGLRYMSFVNVASARLVCGYLEKHKGTLKDIRLSPTYDITSTLGNWRLLSSVIMPQLTELHIHDCSNPSVHDQLPDTIRNSRNLRTVRLQYSAADDVAHPRPTDSIFYALTELVHLSILGLSRFHIHNQAFLRFLDHVASQPQFNRLSIVECGDLNSSIVQRTASIPSLHTLTLFDFGYELTETAVHELTALIGRLPRLRCLKLSGVTLTDTDFYNLAASTSLRQLFLYSYSKVSPEAELLLQPVIVNYNRFLELDDETDTCCRLLDFIYV
ncbi:hypothetical protein BJV82DRAFT_656355 [Fennellomyces sp. T-0311]|nr:hypothetical protein BJV82DRAFT_656355 [Fennellomyces sp. T-0311]